MTYHLPECHANGCFCDGPRDDKYAAMFARLLSIPRFQRILAPMLWELVRDQVADLVEQIYTEMEVPKNGKR